MTAVSQNGWVANDPRRVSSRLVPGTQVRLTVHTGPAGDLLLAVAGEFDARVQDIDNARGALDDWGFAERPIRGSATELSNHASGTAIDLNSTRWPLGSSPSVNLSPAQIGTVRAIVARTGGVIRWGGDYLKRKDPMHFEVNDGRSEADCTRALAGFVAMPATPTTPGARVLRLTDPHMTGADVAVVQARLNRDYPSYSRLVPDGDYGPATEAVVRTFQERARLDVDGAVGPATLRALHLP